MSRITLRVPGDVSAAGLGKNTPFLNTRGLLYAGYLIGTGYTDNPLQDLSRNGRDMTQTGGAIGATSMVCGPTGYLVCPFTGAELAAVGGTLTKLCIAKIGSASNALLMSPGLFFASTSLSAPSNAPVGAINRDGVNVTGTANVTSGVDVARGTRFEMYAATFSTTSQSSYRGWGDPDDNAAQTAATARTAGDGALGGTNPEHIGYGSPGSAGWTTATPEIVAALYFAGTLTTNELDAQRRHFTTLLGDYSVTL